MTQRNEPSWQIKLARRVKAEPMKAVVLGVLIIVMVALWGRMMSKDGEGAVPASASASASIDAPPPVAIPQTASQIQTAKNGTDSFREWLSGRLPTVSRNLFAIQWDYFPQVATRTNGANSENFWDQLAKSINSRADEETRRKAIMVGNLCQEATQHVRLESTMVSPENPKAMINGKLVKVGDVVEGFRLVRIEARRIFVEREGITLSVPLQ